MIGILVLGVFDSGKHSLAAFLDRAVWQANNLEAVKGGHNVDFDLDEGRGNSLCGGAT